MVTDNDKKNHAWPTHLGGLPLVFIALKMLHRHGNGSLFRGRRRTLRLIYQKTESVAFPVHIGFSPLRRKDQDPGAGRGDRRGGPGDGRPHPGDHQVRLRRVHRPHHRAPTQDHSRQHKDPRSGTMQPQWLFPTNLCQNLCEFPSKK